MGAFTPGVPALVLGRLHEVTGGHDQHADWGLATSAFAVAQAVSAYGYSWLYAQGSSYASLFGVGALALAAALAACVSSARPRGR
jgi:predicted MFS family arabinose efflux permease